MIDIENIKSCLEVLGSYSAEEIETYNVLILAAKSDAEKRLAEAGEEYEDKAVLFAAAKVNYQIALIRYSADRVTSFKAGDVSISQSDDTLKNAEALYAQITSDCCELTGGNGFVFRTV